MQQGDLKYYINLLLGQNSSVCIATRYGLDCPRAEFRWGNILRTHSDGRWSRPSFLFNVYRVLFPDVKRPEHGDDHSPLLAPRLKKE